MDISGYQSLQRQIGLNARDLRLGAGLTLDQVSTAARRRGLKWSESRVADFEAGRVAPTLNTLLAFCLALNDLGCQEASLPAFVKYGGTPLKINDALALLDEDIAHLMTVEGGYGTKPVELATDDAPSILGWKRTPFERRVFHRYEVDITTSSRIWRAAGATEDRIRKTLGISPGLLAHLSAALWGKSFTEERDHRAGEGANAQKRGRISRDMLAELKTAMEGVRRGHY